MALLLFNNVYLYTCIHIISKLKYRNNILGIMRTVKLTKIKNEYALIVPESISKLYNFEDKQIFHLEVKESNNMQKLLFLTYATTVK